MILPFNCSVIKPNTRCVSAPGPIRSRRSSGTLLGAALGPAGGWKTGEMGTRGNLGTSMFKSRFPGAPGPVSQGPVPHSTNHSLSFPIQAASGPPVSVSLPLVQSARGKYTKKRCIWGKTLSWLLLVPSAGTGWTLHPCVHFIPRCVKHLHVVPGSYIGTARIFEARLAAVSRQTRVLFHPQQCCLQSCVAEGQKSQVFGTRSQLRPKRWGHCG